MKKILLVVSFAFVFLHTNLSAQDIKVEINAPKYVEVNSPFEVSYTINLANDQIAFTPPNFENFSVLSGPAMSTTATVQIIDGVMVSKKATSHTYILMCELSGEYTIGAAEWQSDTKTFMSKSISLDVLSPSSADSVRLKREKQEKSTQNILKVEKERQEAIARAKKEQQETIAFADAAEYTMSAEHLSVLRESNPAKFKISLADNMLLTYGYITDIIEETESEYNPLFGMTMEKTYYDVLIENSIVVRVELDSEVARISKGDTMFALVVNSGKTKYIEKLPILTPIFSQLKSDFFINNRFCFFESLNEVKDFMVKTRTLNIHSSYFTVQQGDDFYFQNLLKPSK